MRSWTWRMVCIPFLLAMPAAADPMAGLDALAAAGEDPQELARGFDGLPAGKKTLSRVAGGVFKAADALDSALTPHEDFTRPVQRKDLRALRDQAAHMLRDIREKHLYDDGRLFLSILPGDMGDMAIWQGHYAAMAALQAYREESPEAVAYAEAAFDGLEKLYRPGLPLLRGILPDGADQQNVKSRYHHVEDGSQRLEDASIDQAAGWLLGVLMVERTIPSRRTRARRLVTRFAHDLLENGLRLRNSDGSKTRHGNMGAGLVSPPPGVLVTLAALNVAAQDSPDGEYREALEELAEKHQDVWASKASAPALWMTKAYNHNIGIVGLASAVLAEQDAERWLHFARGMTRMARITEREGNSYWLYLTAWALQARPEMLAWHADDADLRGWLERKGELMALARKSMLEFDYPRGKQAWETLNSERKDLAFVKWPLSGKKTVAQPLPVWQRPASDFVWQRDAYSLDDWRGHKDSPARSFTGLDFLLARELALAAGGLTPAD